MAKRPRRSSYSLETRLRRIMASDPSLAAAGTSSAEDVANAIRSRRPEHRRYSLEVFTSAVRRALASLPAAGRSGHDSSTTTSSSSPSSFSDTHSPPPPPADPPAVVDVTKHLLRSRYSFQTSKRRPPEDPAAGARKKQKVESEVTADTDEEAAGGAGSSTAGGGGKGPTFADIGGNDAVIEQLQMQVVVPLCHPELLRWLGVRPIRGILLHGPPGCGKTTLAHAIANEAGVPFYPTSATDLVSGSGVSGASEENIRTLFDKAYRTAPSIVFIDEIDAIASKREDAQRGMERRIVTQLMTCMDELHQNMAGSDDAAASATGSDVDTSQSSEKNRPARYVIVIGATNRPDAVDQALRRPGRFDREICLGVPDENARRQILERLTQCIRLPPEGAGQFDLGKIVRATPGFVGADLKALVDQAGSQAVERIVRARSEGNTKQYRWRDPWKEHEMKSLSVTMADFEKATKEVQPSLRREGFSSVPDVTWADVGGLDSLREELHRCIVRCIKHPEYYEKFGVDMQAGFLLFGPPGCGKTLIAKAVAHEAGANFIHIKGPELLNKYVGEGESGVRKTFARARMNSPCIIFFDEVDALATKRGNDGAWVVERIVNTLLNELDGAGQREGVFVIGATNRIDVVDDALLRPGRFGKKHFVPLPGANERASILKSLARKKPVSSSVDLDAFACREECSNLSGADLASLANKAAMAALEESLESHEDLSCMDPTIELRHFERALSKVKPSVTEQQRKRHKALSKKYSAN